MKSRSDHEADAADSLWVPGRNWVGVEFVNRTLSRVEQRANDIKIRPRFMAYWRRGISLDGKKSARRDPSKSLGVQECVTLQENDDVISRKYFQIARPAREIVQPRSKQVPEHDWPQTNAANEPLGEDLKARLAKDGDVVAREHQSMNCRNRKNEVTEIVGLHDGNSHSPSGLRSRRVSRRSRSNRCERVLCVGEIEQCTHAIPQFAKLPRSPRP